MSCVCQFWSVTIIDDQAVNRLKSCLPVGDFRRIVIKPNWVKHSVHPEFPAEAMVTSPDVIECIIECCLDRYPAAESIMVGDVPLQSCDWEKLKEQSGISRLRAKYAERQRPKIEFHDWRLERYQLEDGYLHKKTGGGHGDPAGYREVILDRESSLEPISHQSSAFRVSDYDPKETVSRHRLGFHRYLICGSVLDADLVISVPKLKTHQKAGITAALKNLVGVNGSKAYLVHHRQGQDEFSPDISPWIRLQVRIREALQKRSTLSFKTGRYVWRLIRRRKGIQTVATRDNLRKSMYIGAGSWYGNDTLWRMIYDLNWIIRYAPREGGALCPVPQRAYMVVMDALVAGEGDGPLQALPVPLGLLGVSDNPFLMDLACAQMMGFDWRKIPVLDNMSLFKADSWGALRPDSVGITVDGHSYRSLDAVPVLHHFIPPPGWKGHIEATSGDGLDESRKGAGHA